MRTVGYRLADKVLNQINNEESWERISDPVLYFDSSTINLEVQNPGFVFLDKAEIIDKDEFYIDNKVFVNSEIDLFSIGKVNFLTIPGEIFPEILTGGVESPENGDYKGPIIEQEGLINLMPGKYNFIIGLTNDMVGYIIPKTQWDEKSPYTYQLNKRPSHEEGSSMGPDVSGIIYLESKRLIERYKTIKYL